MVVFLALTAGIFIGMVLTVAAKQSEGFRPSQVDLGWVIVTVTPPE